MCADAKYGREIMAQPGMVAWQIFDAKSKPLQRDEYHIREVTRVESDTLAGLAEGAEVRVALDAAFAPDGRRVAAKERIEY